MVGKIVVLSDTHMPTRCKKLPPKLLDEIKQCNLIIHAGDWCNKEMYQLLREYAPVEGVCGNNDKEDIMDMFSNKKIIEFEGKKIGVAHGHQGEGVSSRASTEEKAVSMFVNDQVDVVIFGHSHIPVLRKEQDVWILNPGSATDKRKQKQFSFAVMHISESSIDIEIIKYDEKI
ncbi:vacuolar protein-sorting protein 29 [Acrasis kona]|uniref:Vacuolar protein sorting-associated protein 29 n=1 Tax=Acrasis kona TaxID=1008807 RepID=A0AAW2ZQY9_9EUKA